jgi:hypothetical protein
MQTTTTGRDGQRYLTPFSSIPARSIHDLLFDAVDSGQDRAARGGGPLHSLYAPH